MPPRVSNQPPDYEPVLPARRARPFAGDDGFDLGPHDVDTPGRRDDPGVASFDPGAAYSDLDPDGADPRPSGHTGATAVAPTLKRGHAFTYAGLFLFTFYLFYRPYEFLPLPANLAFWFAALTLVVYLPTQLGAEGNLTARPREVNLVLLFALAGLLSIPMAKGGPGLAWDTFSHIFIRAVLIFVVMVNVVRTERRLRWLVLLALGSACWLAAGALNDYRLGNLAVEGYRVRGNIGGIFTNPNDMALHLVTMLGLAGALFFGARGVLKKLCYGVCALLFVAGTAVTFSRGGFLALLAVCATLAWTLGRRNRATVVVLALVAAVAFAVLAPGNYFARILSIYDRSLDAFGSANARQELLLLSVKVALRNPLFGIGMGNFPQVSFRSAESHNAYTQVASEMGLAALAVYLLFILTPLKHLRRIVRETSAAPGRARFYYLAAGLQAGLVGYIVASFFASVAYYWNVYYLVGYAVCLRRLYDASSSGVDGGARAASGGGGARGEGSTG